MGKDLNFYEFTKLRAKKIEEFLLESVKMYRYHLAKKDIDCQRDELPEIEVHANELKVLLDLITSFEIYKECKETYYYQDSAIQ